MSKKSPLKKAAALLWLEAPEAHDYPAAADYLSLLLSADTITPLIERLKTADITHYKAKDILRASRLELLKPTNKHVKKDLDKVAAGKSLSPVLLVRGSLSADRPLTVADGYHRVCASYWLDENTDIPCKLVDL